MRTFLVSLFMLVSLTLAIVAAADASAHTSPALLSVAAALPDTLPLAFDWNASDASAAAPEVHAPRTARTVRAFPSVDVPKVWTCSAPRGLASDASATVRVCEYR